MRIRIFPCLFFGLLTFSLLCGGCAVNPATGKKELALFQVSAPEEIAIGEKTFPRALQQMGGEYPDARLGAYVNEIGRRLGRLSQRPDLPFTFKVVNDSTPNAFALPGGFIAISRGLLVNLENEAQLAAVLGHEVGHVAARHAVQGLQRGALFNVALAVLSGVTGEGAYGPLAEQAGQLTASLLENSYSREQERESDRLGIDYMVGSGYNPQGAVQVQEFFYRQLEGGEQPMWLAGLFRTHPFSKERMLANGEYIHTYYPRALTGSEYALRPEPFREATARLRSVREGYDLYDEARRLEARDNLPAAIETYLKALEAAPNEGLIYAGLGLASIKAGDVNPARRYLLKAVQLNRDYYQSHLGLGYVYLQKGENAAAVQALERSMELLPTLQGGYLLAEGYEKTGEVPKALELYRAVADADPKGKLGRSAAERVQGLGGRL
jgi:predicted Zn-dependent protease